MSSSSGSAPLIHNAVWDAAQLRVRPEWQQTLSPAEAAELSRLAEGATFDGDAATVRGVPLEQTGPDALEMPLTAQRLASIREELENGCGLVRLSGLPLRDRSEATARLLFWALSVHLGTPVSQSAQGEKLFSVRDLGFAENDPRTRGPNTNKRLSFHTDRCDVIGFFCLQPAREGGENEVVSSMRLFNEIQRRRPDLLAVLMEPFHYQRHTVDRGNEQPWCRQPIFSFQEGHFACSFLRVLIERAHRSPELPNLSEPQIEALDFLETVADEDGMSFRFRQERGDVVFLNNWVTLHRRTGFSDDTDPSRKRHILRVWLAMPNSRPLHPLFKANYGSTEAGAMRGGMRALAGSAAP